MSNMKRHLEEIMMTMTLEQRVCFLINSCGYSSEDAKEYAKAFEEDGD